MSHADNIVELDAHREAKGFDGAEARLLKELVRFTLIESLENFQSHRREYPFVAREKLFPSVNVHNREWHYQHPAFVILLDGVMPRPLNKNFRLRLSNLVSWRNLLKVLPESELKDFKAADCDVETTEFSSLLKKLLPLDFALLVQREGPRIETQRLTHMHVKVERLTDIAIRELGKELSYIDRTLFERGEDYVESLEAKFFEYFGFSAHASGRKSAAAMAAQLLMKYDTDFTVFVASQSDLRLTLLRNHHRIEQYFLIALGDAAYHQLSEQYAPEVLDRYQIDRLESGEHVFIYRVHFDRTAAALPGDREIREKSLQARWLDFVQGEIVDAELTLPQLPFDWVNSPASEEIEVNPSD